MIAPFITSLTVRIWQFVLFFFLLFQIGLWSHFRIEGKICLPERAVLWIAESVSPSEMKLGIEEIALQKNGPWTIRGISATVMGDISPSIEIHQVSFVPSPRGIFDNGPWVRWLRMDGLRLYGSGPGPATGKPILHLVSSFLEKKDSSLAHSGTLAEAGKLDLLISGGDSQSLFRLMATLEDLIPKEPDEPAPELTTADQIRLAQLIFEEVRAKTDWLSDPLASIRLGPSDKNSNELALEGWIFSPAVTIDTLEAKSSEIQGRVSLASPVKPLRFEVMGKELSLWEDLQIQEWHLQSSLSLIEILSGRVLPEEVFFSASAFSGRHFHFSAPLVRIFNLTSESLALRAALDWMNHPVEAWGTVRPWDGKLSLNLSGLLDPEQVARETWLPDNLPKNFIQSEKPSHLQLTVETSSAWVLEKIRFRAALGAAILHGLPASRGYAEGYLTPETFHTEHFEILNPNYELQGSYHHGIQDDDFRFLLKGGFLPDDINAWMSGWWERTWANFNFTGNPPRINFDIGGNWRQRWNRDVFGAVEFSDLQYRELEAEHGHSRVRFIPNFFELSNLEIHRPEGSARGRLRWIRKPDGEGDRSFELDVESTIFPSAYGELVGPEIAALLRQFEFTNPPRISVMGKIFFEDRSPFKEGERLAIQATTNAPFSFYGLPMENLLLTANYSNRVVRVTDLDFGFAGGSGFGQLKHDPREIPRPLQLNLSLENAHPGKAWQSLPFITEEQKARFGQFEELDDSLLSLTFAGIGDFPTLESFQGLGSIDLQSANLANVRLFGVISRLIEALPLPFYPGSINFHHLKADFRIANGKIHSENLKLLGATTRVEARGSYSMPDSQLDFMATLNPLRESSFPLLSEFSRLLQPFGRILEFRVTGPPEDPDIRFRVDPRSTPGQDATPSTLNPPGR